MSLKNGKNDGLKNSYRNILYAAVVKEDEGYSVSK
jgi:hypothetical protein